MPMPERYIVHIYRREGVGDSSRVAGLVEKVGNGSQQAFSSGVELWALLNSRSRSSRSSTRLRRKPGKK
jgi:hypothetical protein